MTDIEGWRTKGRFHCGYGNGGDGGGVVEEVAEGMVQMTDMKVVVVSEVMKMVVVAETAKVLVKMLVKMLVGGGGLSDGAGGDGGGSGDCRNGNGSFK